MDRALEILKAAAGRDEPQPRDRAAPLQGSAPGSDYAFSLNLLKRFKDCARRAHQERPDGRPGRDRRGDPAGDARHARARHRHADHRPVPRALGPPPAGAPLRAPRHLQDVRGEAAKMGFSHARSARWCAPATTPTSRRRRPAWPEPERARWLPRRTAKGTVACGNCHEPMQRLMLPGHYGRTVEVDLCGHCHLVWFDLTETRACPARAARPDRRDGADAAPAAPHARREGRLRAVACGAEDGAQPLALGRLAAPRDRAAPATAPTRPSRSSCGRRACCGPCRASTGRACCRPGPHRLRQLRAAIARDEDHLPLLRLGAQPARRGAPGARARSRGALEPQAVHRDAVRQQALQCRPAARRCRRACRWTARNAARRWRSAVWPTPTSAWSRSAGLRAHAQAFARGGEAPPRGARCRPAAPREFTAKMEAEAARSGHHRSTATGIGATCSAVARTRCAPCCWRCGDLVRLVFLALSRRPALRSRRSVRSARASGRSRACRRWRTRPRLSTSSVVGVPRMPPKRSAIAPVLSIATPKGSCRVCA